MHLNIIPLSLVKFITTDICVNRICRWPVGATEKRAGEGREKIQNEFHITKQILQDTALKKHLS